MSRTSPADPPAPRREHPWERSRRIAFAGWEADVRRTPYDHPVPDVVGFADAVEPSPQWADVAGGHRLFALSALPTGRGASYLAAVSARQRRPVDGALVRLRQPVKRVLPAPDSAFGELLIEASNGTTAASWEEILPGVSPRSVASVVPELAALWHLPRFAVETLLLPLVGSFPWHGRPAELNLYVEVDDWSLARQRSFLGGLLELAPDWVSSPRRGTGAAVSFRELASGARLRRRSTAASRPFELLIRPISRATPPTTGTVPRSVITYGRALTAEFEGALATDHLALLLNAEEVGRVPKAPIELPDALRSTVWGLHWWNPAPPDAPEWHRWLRAEESRLHEAFDAIPSRPPGQSTEKWSGLVERREFRDRLAQASFARARLRGSPEVDALDLVWVVEALTRAVERATEWAAEGRGPWTRVLDRTEGARTTRLRRAVESMLQPGSGGLTVAEAVTALRLRGVPFSERDVENQLERLRIRGVLFQDRAGRYRPA